MKPKGAVAARRGGTARRRASTARSCRRPRARARPRRPPRRWGPPWRRSSSRSSSCATDRRCSRSSPARTGSTPRLLGALAGGRIERADADAVRERDRATRSAACLRSGIRRRSRPGSTATCSPTTSSGPRPARRHAVFPVAPADLVRASRASSRTSRRDVAQQLEDAERDPPDHELAAVDRRPVGGNQPAKLRHGRRRRARGRRAAPRRPRRPRPTAPAPDASRARRRTPRSGSTRPPRRDRRTRRGRRARARRARGRVRPPRASRGARCGAARRRHPRGVRPAGSCGPTRGRADAGRVAAAAPRPATGRPSPPRAGPALRPVDGGARRARARASRGRGTAAPRP